MTTLAFKKISRRLTPRCYREWYFEQLLQRVTETLEALLDVKNAGRANAPHVSMGQLAAHVSLSSGRSQSIARSDSRSDMPLVVKNPVSQGDELGASWFKMVDHYPLITASSKKTAWGYGTLLPYSLRVSLRGYLTRCQ